MAICRAKIWVELEKKLEVPSCSLKLNHIFYILSKYVLSIHTRSTYCHKGHWQPEGEWISMMTSCQAQRRNDHRSLTQSLCFPVFNSLFILLNHTKAVDEQTHIHGVFPLGTHALLSSKFSLMTILLPYFCSPSLRAHRLYMDMVVYQVLLNQGIKQTKHTAIVYYNRQRAAFDSCSNGLLFFWSRKKKYIHFSGLF